METIRFSVLGWSAWAPNVENNAQWVEWLQGKRQIGDDTNAAPAVREVPAMLRRRFSRLTKMALQVAFNCVEQGRQMQTVFCSPHGEIHRTQGLLSEIAAAEAMSPMGFSLSVHNTASGFYSIVSKDKSASISIAAGNDSLEFALLDAVARLSADNSEPILVIFADEPLPEFYQRYQKSTSTPFALALLIGRTEPENLVQKGAAMTLSICEKNVETDSEPHGLQLLHMLNDSSIRSMRFGGDRISWCWERAD